MSLSFCAAAGVSVPDNMRLPGQPIPKRAGSSAVKTSKLDGVARVKSNLLQRANRFKSAENADHAIIFAGVRNRVDMRAGADGGSIRIGSLPANENVADAIVAHGETCRFAALFQPGAGPQIGFGKNDASDNRRLGFGNGSKLFDFGGQAILIDVANSASKSEA